jgi:hypothetical protein
MFFHFIFLPSESSHFNFHFMPARPFQLELNSGRIINNPTMQDLAAHVDTEEFMILSTSRRSQTYMQCASPTDATSGFTLEYQDGSTDNHFAAQGHLTAADVVSAMTKYLLGDLSWHTDFEWQKISF